MPSLHILSRVFRTCARGAAVTATWMAALAAVADESGTSGQTNVPPTVLLAGHSLHGEAFNEGPRQSAYLMGGMPKVSFLISTGSPEAQQFFDQGIGQLHGFWYFEAERSFRQVAALDPTCPMAYWGMAMANVNNEKRAREFLKSAVEHKARASRRETLWIEALETLYPEQKAEEPANRRHREYVRGLEKILEEFPDDLEARTFLLFKIWDNGGKGFSIPSHTAVDALASEVLARAPMHPVHHARIHLWNYEKDARALNSAALCGQSAPGIAHMWHMPAHTYSKLHRYGDAAWQQEASARVDHAHMMRDRVLPDQIHNYAHNNEWLVNNLSHVGRVRDAIALAKNLIELPRHPKFNTLAKVNASGDTNYTALYHAVYERKNGSASHGRGRLLDVLVRHESWSELLALTGTMYLEPTDIPEEQVKRLKARGLAWLGLGNVAAAREEMAELERVRKRQKEFRYEVADQTEEKARVEKQADDKVAGAMTSALQTQNQRIKITETALRELQLYLALSEGNKEEAEKHLAELKNPELPKDRLARVYLDLGDKEKAESAAREAVEGGTNQVQILANYVHVLEQCGRPDEADKVFEQLRAICGEADLHLPAFQRLQPVIERLNLPEDWRSPLVLAADIGERPPLDELGPFRWEPSPAPSWTLRDAEGWKSSLQEYRGQPVVVIFFLGHGCLHCMEQLNAFAPLARDYEEAGIALVAISTDTPEGLKRTLSYSDAPLPFRLLSNTDLDVFKGYGAFDDFEQLPLHGTFLIDGEGLVRWQDIGFEPFQETQFLLTEAQRLLRLRPALMNASSAVEPAH